MKSVSQMLRRPFRHQNQSLEVLAILKRVKLLQLSRHKENPRQQVATAHFNNKKQAESQIMMDK